MIRVRYFMTVWTVFSIHIDLCKLPTYCKSWFLLPRWWCLVPIDLKLWNKCSHLTVCPIYQGCVIDKRPGKLLGRDFLWRYRRVTVLSQRCSLLALKQSQDALDSHLICVKISFNEFPSKEPLNKLRMLPGPNNRVGAVRTQLGPSIEWGGVCMALHYIKSGKARHCLMWSALEALSSFLHDPVCGPWLGHGDGCGRPCDWGGLETLTRSTYFRYVSH